MKKPTLSELVIAAENRVEVAEWYRRKEFLKMFIGLSKSALDKYQQEMEDIPEFKAGILKPGTSTTFININTFIWFLKWKDTNKNLARKYTPQEVLRKEEIKL